MTAERKILIAYGGGMDSACLLQWALNHTISTNIGLVIFFYGQKAWKGEVNSARYFSHKYGVQLFELAVDMRHPRSNPLLAGGGDPASNHNAYVLPMRNLILLTQTALLAHVEGYTSIVAGFHVEPQESQFVDASKTFAMSMKETLIAAGGPLLEFPFVDRERTDFIREFSAQDPEVITRAFSCYEGIEEECGNCTKCQIKAGILQRIQRKDVS